MIVSCGNCGKKYKIDPVKIKGDQARFTCKVCSETVMINKKEMAVENEVNLDDSIISALSQENREVNQEEKAEETVQSSTQPMQQRLRGDQKKAGKRKAGLTVKVILLMLFVGLIPLAVYFWLSFTETTKHIELETTNSGMRTSQNLTAQVDEWIDKNTRVLSTMAELPGMASMNMYEQEILLKAIQQEYPWIYLAFTTDNNGVNTARSDGKGLKDYSDRQYVKDITIQNKDLSWQTLIGKTSGKPALVLAVPILKEGVRVGVLATAMTREAISKIVTNYKQGDTGSVFLVDDTGKVVAHQNYDFVTGQKDFGSHPLVVSGRKQEPGMIEFTGESGEKIIGFARPTKLGWILGVQQERGEAFETLSNSQRYALILLGITTVAIVIIAYFSSKAIVSPIRKLTDAANRISVGELGVNIDIRSKDEIGELADAITRMQDSIKLSISRLKRRKR